MLAFAPASIEHGAGEIRAVYADLPGTRPRFTLGDQQPAVVNDDFASTSCRLTAGGTTGVVAGIDERSATERTKLVAPNLVLDHDTKLDLDGGTAKSDQDHRAEAARAHTRRRDRAQDDV